MVDKYPKVKMTVKLIFSNPWDKRIKPLEIELTRDQFAELKRMVNEMSW